jgi:hypothetical protein
MDALTPAHEPYLEVTPAASYLPWRPTLRQGLDGWGWSARNHLLPQDVSAWGGQVSLFPLLHLPSILPPTTPCRPDALSGVFCHRAYRRTHPCGCAVSSRTLRLGFRHWLAGSPRQQAESSLRRLIAISLYCGLDVRLRLLPTPPRGDAVTFGYEEPDIPRRGLSPRQCNNITGALAGRFNARWQRIDIRVNVTTFGRVGAALALIDIRDILHGRLVAAAPELVRSELEEGKNMNGAVP